MVSVPRIAIAIDEELQRKRFGEYLGAEAQLFYVPGGDELVKLALGGTVEAVVVGVLNRTDPLLPFALRELGRATPEVAVAGVFEPSAPSLDEAADLARDNPTMGFVLRPGARLSYLTRRRSEADPPPTFTPWLLDCMDRLPLFGPARSFALLQALHPSCASSIPQQARELSLSRRNLERWFQGPDLCSPSCFQSVCGAAEAAYLRVVRSLPEREIAPIVGILTRDGLENPLAVPRTIRSALRLGLEELRPGGVPVLLQAVDAALRIPRDAVRIPAQWGPETRFKPEPGVLVVPVEDRLVLVNATRGLEHPLDGFGMDAWPLVSRGASFADMVSQLAAARQEPTAAVRARLIAWLGDLLVLRLIRRERGNARVINGM